MISIFLFSFSLRVFPGVSAIVRWLVLWPVTPSAIVQWLILWPDTPSAIVQWPILCPINVGKQLFLLLVLIRGSESPSSFAKGEEARWWKEYWLFSRHIISTWCGEVVWLTDWLRFEEDSLRSTKIEFYVAVHAFCAVLVYFCQLIWVPGLACFHPAPLIFYMCGRAQNGISYAI